MDDTTFAQLDKSRNLIPVLSIEGDKEITDTRRGEVLDDRRSERARTCDNDLGRLDAFLAFHADFLKH